MWISKLALRVVQFVLAIATVGCAGSIISTGLWSILTLIVIMPQAIVSAVWSLAEGICLVVRAGHRGIHPGANVALDLLLWLGLVAGTVVLWLLGVATMIVGGVVDSGYDWNWDDSSSGYGYSASAVSASLGKVAGMGQALIGLGATLTILHFTTFVIACVETSKRNRAQNVVFVTAAQYPPYGYDHGAQTGVYSPGTPAPVYQQGGAKA